MNTPIVCALAADLTFSALIGLKLIGWCDLPWWFVTLPFWITWPIAGIVAAAVALILAIIWAIAAWRRA